MALSTLGRDFGLDSSRLRKVWPVVAAVAGGIVAAVALPALLPGIATAVAATAAHAFWYLSRASAFVALILSWLSMVFGLLITSKAAKTYPGMPAAFDLHKFTSFMSLGVVAFHALVLLGDTYSNYSLVQLLVPFATGGSLALAVGIGQIALYAAALVSFTFYMRKQIGQRGWRLIHFLSFAVFAAGIAHGLLSGTDTGAVWASLLYWFLGVSVTGLTAYRIVAAKA